MASTAWIEVHKIGLFQAELFWLWFKFFFLMRYPRLIKKLFPLTFLIWGRYQYEKSCYLVKFGRFCTFLATLLGFQAVSRHPKPLCKKLPYSILGEVKNYQGRRKIFARYSDFKVGASSQCYWDELMLLKCDRMLLKCLINTNTNKNRFLLSTKCLERVLKYSYLVSTISLFKFSLSVTHTTIC